MPLHVARLRDSDLASEESPEACWYAVLLWSASWHQIPAASLPDNDAVLTKLIGLGKDVRTFRRHKAAAMRGFVLCSDGRLYHPVVAEQAVDSWRRKLEQRWRTECARVKKRNQRDKTDVSPPTLDEFLAALSSPTRPLNVPEDIELRPQGHYPPSPGTDPPCPQGNGIQGTGTGTGTSNSVPNGTDAEASDDDLDPLADLRALPVAKGCWRIAVKVLAEQGRMSDPKARAFVGKLKRELSDEELWQIAEAAWTEQTEDPAAYLVKAAQGVVERRDAGPANPLLTPEDWRQRKWLEEFVEGRFRWDTRRGPEPGQPGCRVSADLLREFNIAPVEPVKVTEGRAA